VSRSATRDAAIRSLGEPIDRLIAGYALVSGVALFFPFRPSAWPVLAGLHLVAVILGAAPRPLRHAWNGLGRHWPRLATLIGDWYPLVLVPALYAELAPLNRAVHDGRFFDDPIIAVEQAVFRGQPSRDWAAAVPDLMLSELLHASYLAYYIIIYLPPLVMYARGMRHAFRTTVFTLLLTFFAHYIFFIYFPVQGPRYLFAAPGGAIAGGFFYQLAHRILEAGSSQGAAFPSSHVGVSVAQTLMDWRYIRPLALPIGLLTLGLACGAVYAGFHYATDAVLGAVLGVLAARFGPGLHARLETGIHA
jgi:membrane-associated phospholipid phosphatase